MLPFVRTKSLKNHAVGGYIAHIKGHPQGAVLKKLNNDVECFDSAKNVTLV